MKSKPIRRIGSVILAIAMLLCINLSSVLAQSEPTTDGSGRDPDRDVSLTLTKYENDPDKSVPDLTPLAGIPFRLQLVELKPGEQQGSTDPDDYLVIRTIGDDTGKATNSAGVVTWNKEDDGLVQGIYLVTELASATVSNPSIKFLVSLPMYVDGVWDYEVEAFPKNDPDSGPVIDKDEVTDSGNGNVITWQYNMDIPADIEHAQNLVITDKLDQQLTYRDGSIEGWYVNRAGEKKTLAATFYTATYPNSENKLVITILTNGFAELAKALAGAGSTKPTLHFKFETSVSTTDEGNLGIIKNGGELDYTNEDGYVYDTNTIPDIDKPDADLYGIHIYKINVNGMELKDAEFMLYKDQRCGNEDLVTSDVYTTDDEGNAYIYGLAEGTYYLKETKAPTGYNAITTPITVVLNEATANTNYLVKITVTNSNGFTLPQTGGMGTMLFTIGGLALIAVACALLLAAKKKKSKT